MSQPKKSRFIYFTQSKNKGKGKSESENWFLALPFNSFCFVDE